MASHDENISQNRRRLFKALSAAPVVATLSPGEALARQSSYQCTTKEMPPAGDKFHKSTNVPCTSVDNPSPGQIPGTGCHAYEQRFFYDPGITGKDSLDNCAFWNDKFVVETSAGKYYVILDPPGVSGGSIVPSPVPAANAITLGRGQISFWGADGDVPGAQPCAIADMKRGLFLAIGEPVIVDGEAVNWVSKGVWPELPLGGGQGALAGSCLTSFPNSTGFILADS